MIAKKSAIRHRDFHRDTESHLEKNLFYRRQKIRMGIWVSMLISYLAIIFISSVPISIIYFASVAIPAWAFNNAIWEIRERCRLKMD